MPYESPNIVIVPTVLLNKSKNTALDQSHTNKPSTDTVIIDLDGEDSNMPDTQDTPENNMNKSPTNLVSDDNTNKLTNLVSDDKSMNETTSENVKGSEKSAPEPVTKVACVTQNSTRVQDTKKNPNTSWASNYIQSIRQGGTTKPSILCTSNDSLMLTVANTSEVKNADSTSSMNNVASTGEKKDPPIKINLLSRSKVTKTADTTPATAFVQPIENTNTGSRSQINMGWPSQPVPQIPANEIWISHTPYQPIYPSTNTCFGPADASFAPQCLPNINYTQNENINTNNINTNFVCRNESQYTHYYTPSYKSPMDSAWLNEQYYAQLVNDQSYKYYNQINQYENMYPKNTVTTSIVRNEKDPQVDTMPSSLDNKVMQPNKIESSTKINNKRDEGSGTSKTIKTKKPINPNSFNLSNSFVEESSRKETKVKNQAHETSDSKSKKSTSQDKTVKARSSKSELEARNKVKEMLQKQIQKIESLIAKKRKQSPEKPSKTQSRHEEDSHAKKRKLTQHSDHYKSQECDRGSKTKPKHSRDGNESNPEPNRKRTRRSSNSEYQPKKRIRRNSENDNRRSSSNTPIKSIVKNPQVKHPRIQPPESKISYDDFDLIDQSDFDLRSKLRRANYNHYLKNKAFYDSQFNDKTENERENLLITINRSEEDDAQPLPGPSKPKPKSKKYKKIQLVINVICDNQDSSENSSSDENESKNTETHTVKIIDNESKLKPDLSFLDDINIDEIVSSLKNQQKTIVKDNNVNAQQNIKQASENNTKTAQTCKKFVQPIIIKREIKTEHEDSENNLDNSFENPDTINSGFLNSTEIEQSTESIGCDANEPSCADILQNIKQEKHVDIEDKVVHEQNVQNLEGIALPTIEEQVSARDDHISQTANQHVRGTMMENICTNDTSTSTPEVIHTVKSEPRDYDDAIVNQEVESQIVITSNNHKDVVNLHDSINTDFFDEDTQELDNYNIASEPVDIDRSNSLFSIVLQKNIKEENNNELKSYSYSETTPAAMKSISNVTEVTKPSTGDKIIQENVVLCAANNANTIGNATGLVQSGNNTHSIATQIIPTPGSCQTKTLKNKMEYQNSNTVESVVKNETPEYIESNNVGINTNSHVEIKENTENNSETITAPNPYQDEISKSESQSKINTPVESIVKIETVEVNDNDCIVIDTNSEPEIEDNNQTCQHTSEVIPPVMDKSNDSADDSNITLELNKKAVAVTSGNVSIQIAKPINDSKLKTIEEDQIKKIPDIKKVPNTTKTQLHSGLNSSVNKKELSTDNITLELNKKAVAVNSGNASIQISKAINDSKLKTIEKELQPNISVKCNVTEDKIKKTPEIKKVPNTTKTQLHSGINPSDNKKDVCTDTSVKSNENTENKIKKLPQTNKVSNNTKTTTTKSPLVSSADKEKVEKPELKTKNIEQKVAPATTAKSGAKNDQKESTTANSSPKNADKTRTVEIKPSLKSNKVLAVKIELRIQEYLKLEVNVTSLIQFGKYSKIFHCKGANGQQYAVKFIKDEQNRTTLGINKETMLLALQKDIPKQNQSTVHIINGFGLERNWCFLMDYYPKNLAQGLREAVFDMDTVQDLARQLVSAVMVMRNNNVVHSDIKPTHILLDAANRRLKVCGFDEAYYVDDLAEVLPNIGSAIYRAPEVIVGFSADFAIDVWTTALVIYEMVAGSRLFQHFQNFNNNTLFFQMNLLGFLPIDMIQMARFGHKHFVGNAFKRFDGHQCVLYLANNFGLKQEIYPILKKVAVPRWPKVTKQKHIKDLRKLSRLSTLLDKMLALDPRERIPIEYVCSDPYFVYKNTRMNESFHFSDDV